MYLLVLAFTFVNCYFLMYVFLHLLSLFTYCVQIPFLNQINKIFKLPYFFRISCENLFLKDHSNEEVFTSEESDNNPDDELDQQSSNKDEETEDEEIDKKSIDIEDFIEIRKNKFLIDESLD